MANPAQHSALATQVGGHPGILSDASGEVVVKPLLPVELAFYELLEGRAPALAPLAGLTPTFMGVLELQGELAEPEGAGKELGPHEVGQLLGGEEVEGVKPVAEGAGEPRKHIVLSNASHPFTHPCILDVKLGTVLYDEDATAEKRARMTKRALDTTSAETGIRLTGFQNWDASTGTVVSTPKAFGVALQSADLPSGIERFFPLSTPSSPAGLPHDLLLEVLDRIALQTEGVHRALEQTEARFVGMSLLVVYEGCPTALREALARTTAESESDDGESSAKEDEDDGDGSGSDAASRSLATRVKLIDFAHSRPAPEGSGPDAGVLKGLDTVRRLLAGRRAEVVSARAQA